MSDIALPQMGLGMLARAMVRRPAARPLAAGGLVREFAFAGLDADHVAAYRTEMGFDDDAMPLTYVYLLAQRAQLATMLSPQFPFSVAGMVHTGNNIILKARPQPGQRLTLRTVAVPEPPTSRGAVYVRFDVAFRRDGEDLLHCESRYLAKRGQQRNAAGAPKAEHDQRWIGL